MAAFLIAHATIHDPEAYAAYSAAATETIEPYGGSLTIRGAVNEVLEGAHDYKVMAVISFPDQASLKAWYASDAYQALIPTREGVADITLIAYDEPPG
ncbi:MAG: DUF1330 domain-containing protein [Alphaproteobacteria bacterium]|nr:DUF1330 domain-containing protein [Alphaproteobacteria bacterium]